MKRINYLNAIEHDFCIFKTVGLLGPRQVGKTTLAREYCSRISNFPWQTNYFDLEDPTALRRLDDAKLALSSLRGLVVIDEVQRRPDLFPIIRYLLDRKENDMKLLILGSASRELIQQSSESLAGRISYLEVHPFSLEELSAPTQETLWLRGGYPLAYLAQNDQNAFSWLAAYIRTYLEQDIPNLGLSIPAETLRRFWMMLVHNHGNILNTADLARSFGIADTTARRYIDLLSGTFMLRQLQPFLVNIKKRQVKSPKIYFRDTGLLHQLMGIADLSSLTTHIKCGASWEGFALEQVIRSSKAKADECYFWGVHSQGEIDLIIEQEGKLLAYEFKYSSAPSITASMNLALQTLPIEKLTVIAPVENNFALSKNIFVSSLASYITSAVKNSLTA